MTAAGRTRPIHRPLTQSLVAFLILALLVSGECCAPHAGAPKGGALDDIRFFAYQIQEQEANGNIRKLANSRYDLLVIDQTRSVRGMEEYDSARDVSLLKGSTGSSGQPKKVVCYLDVGEAESYRWYWDPGWKVGDPEWIVAADPDGWDENFPVEFWRIEWKSIMRRALDRIVADGYDGVYLDWLEAYSFEPVARAAASEGLDPEEEIVRFVEELSRHARRKKPGFIFIAQNAAEMGANGRYLDVFDAVSQEAIWFDGGGDPDEGEEAGDVTTTPGETEELLEDLALWKRLGKPVFNVEYARRPSNVERAYSLGEERGFKTYVTLRLLDSLTDTAPPGYDR